MKLTDQIIAELEPRENRYQVWDGGVGVIVSPKGKKRYIIARSSEGKRTTVTLGPVEEMTISEVRHKLKNPEPSPWAKLAARTLWYAGMWRRNSKATLGAVDRLAKILDADPNRVERELAAIVASIPDGDGRLVEGKLVIKYKKFAKEEKAPKVPEEDVQRVFDHWRRVFDKPKAVLGKKSRAAVAGRLAEGFSVAQLCKAIDGLSTSQKHIREKHIQLTLICRDEEHVAKYTRWLENGLPSVLVEENPEENESMIDRVRRMYS